MVLQFKKCQLNDFSKYNFYKYLKTREEVIWYHFEGFRCLEKQTNQHVVSLDVVYAARETQCHHGLKEHIPRRYCLNLLPACLCLMIIKNDRIKSS